MADDNGRASRARRGANTVSTPLDEEGTVDVWRVAIEKFARGHGGKYDLEDDITEEESVDWVTEQDVLAVSLTRLEEQHAFVPRIGELVLWIVDFPSNAFLMLHPDTQEYRYYSFKTRRFGDCPVWRTGVVTTVPTCIATNGPMDFNDLLSTPIKRTSLTTSGFRVETMPDPNNTDKSWSKQYKYIPLRNMRPLSQWRLILKGIKQTDLHPSILYALSCMTSISLVGKWFFRSGWPHGTVLARSAYIGSELLTVGDVVRLMPDQGQVVTDVMVIDNIRYHIQGVDVPLQTQDDSRIGTRSFLTFSGIAYTVDKTKAYKHATDQQQNGTVRLPRALTLEEVATSFRPVRTSEYGSWYPLHSPEQRWEVSHEHVVGRLYEADAVRLWLGQRQTEAISPEQVEPSLSYDISSIQAGRRYASQTDERLGNPPDDRPDEVQWSIFDSRAEALDIATFNGHQVFPHHEIRDTNTMQAWRTHLKYAQGKINLLDSNIQTSSRRGRKAMIIYDDDGNPIQTRGYYIPDATTASTSDQDGLRRRGRKAGSKLIGGKVYQASELLARPELLDQLKKEQEQGSKQVQVPTPSRRRLQASSQMAGAAMEESSSSSSSDSLEVTDDDEEEEIKDSQQNQQHTNDRDTNGDTHSMSVPDEDLGQAYGIDADSNSDTSAQQAEEEAEAEEAEDPIPTLSQFQRPRNLKRSSMVAKSIADDNNNDSTASSSPSRSRSVSTTTVSATAHTLIPMPIQSKSQLAQSIEKHSETIEIEMADDDGDSEGTDEEEEEFDLEEWKHPRNARGGTVESDGGDYHSSQ